MPKITVYLPQELADFVSAEKSLNVSSLVQRALRREQVLRAQADEVAQDRADGLIDEEKVEEWRRKLDAMGLR